MGKLVVLRLDGELFQQGFRVTLTIKSDCTPSSKNSPALYLETEITGHLPPHPKLATHYKIIGSKNIAASERRIESNLKKSFMMALSTNDSRNARNQRPIAIAFRCMARF
jgi:hypothetical protein